VKHVSLTNALNPERPPAPLDEISYLREILHLLDGNPYCFQHLNAVKDWLFSIKK